MSLLWMVDLVLLTVWTASLVLAWTVPGRRPPRMLGAGIVIVAMVAVLGHRLEIWTGGRAWNALPLTLLGLACVGAGAWLHGAARAALWRAWSPLVEPGETLVTRGPYAWIRHPAYAGILIMALGTLLAHGTAAVAAAVPGLMVGLVLKARLEDRRMAQRFGPDWLGYALRVPGWIPDTFTPDTPE